MLVRVKAIASADRVEDPVYAEGLRLAVSTAISYSWEALERGAERLAEPPPGLRAQAALAARNGVGLEVVLRRYGAGYSVLADFIVAEAEALGLPGGALQRLIRDHAATFDGLLAAVSEEHGREARRLVASVAQRRAGLVRRLLSGELLDASALGYELEGFHLGLAACRRGAEQTVRDLAARLDRRVLVVRPDEAVCWAWLGGRRQLAAEEVEELDAVVPPPGTHLGFGEPAEGISGWRLTHRQAVAALAVAGRGGERTARYREVALPAAVLRDDLLSASLEQLYLEPLEAERDGGETLRETLRAYFDAERSAASAAAMLGVSRQTVNTRLRAAERRVGRPLGACGSELEMALRMETLRE